MAADTTLGPAVTVEEDTPSGAELVAAVGRHAIIAFSREPMAAFFTLAFPLIFLVLFSSLIGNETVGGTDVRVAQFITPGIAVLAAITATLTSLSIGLVSDREEGVFRRLRGTPLPVTMLMTGRVVAMAVVSLLATALMVAVGVVVFDVQIVTDKLPAALLTLLVGTLAFCALGGAVAALSPSVAATSAIANGIVIPLSFISEIFVIDADFPRWLDILGWLFPVKHFAVALQETFNPFSPGAGVGWDHLGVMALWGVVGLVVARARFRWEPVGGRSTAGSATSPVTAGSGQPVAALSAAVENRSPSGWSLMLLEARHGLRAFLRTTASAFFTLLFPPVLLAIFFFVFGNPDLESRGGISLVQFAAPALGVYGVAVAAYADFSERVAALRDQGVLKRVRGTPMPAWAFIAGRMASAVVVALASLVITVTVGILFFDVAVVPRMFPGVLLSVVLGISTFTALGLALASVVRKSESVPAIANGTLLPLAFVSDIFLIGDLPPWMDTVGNLFPLKHVVAAVADGFNETVEGFGFFPDHLLVMGIWFIVSLVLALRFFTWSPRESKTSSDLSDREDDATDGSSVTIGP
ncbi:ABC transporter permease [Euzebya tangerina]|uniref:ABC transporter permease n=1 Tax=Euzebya tangerina TaxID=591198 RepID=UPI000E314CFB|nr:ABC transporter permease [Euzebya tangerina]